MPTLTEVVGFLLIPAGVALAGAAASLAHEPGATVRSALHHAAAGAILAAAAAELVVEVVAQARLVAVVLGFAAGAALMLAVSSASRRIEAGARQGPRRVAGFLATVGIDVYVDGVVVGIGFAIAQSSGLVLVAAFALEMAFLGSTTAIELRAAGARRRAIALGPGVLAAFLVLGGITGYYLGALSGFLFELVLAFALAVLVYLVSEELLVEAHREREASGETPLLAASFFIAFLAILALDIALG